MDTKQEFKSHYLANKKTYTLAILLIIFFGVWTLVRETGFRVGESGLIEIQKIAAGSSVFIDGDLVEEVVSGVSTISTDVSPGNHTILVSRENFWPWTKTIEISKEDVGQSLRSLFR